MPLWSLSKERKEDLLKQKKSKQQELDDLKKKTSIDLWKDDLEKFVAELDVSFVFSRKFAFVLEVWIERISRKR